MILNNSYYLLLIVSNISNNYLMEHDDNDYSLELNKIYNEDCILGMKKIKNETVDVVICDPPYNIGKDFGNNSDKQSMMAAERIIDRTVEEKMNMGKK